MLFPPNGAWLLIFDSHLRLAEYGRLRIDPFSIAPAGFFLFRYCRDSVSSLQPRRIHRHINKHGINHIQGAWLVGSHSPPAGETGVQDPHPHPGSLHPPAAAEQGPDGTGCRPEPAKRPRSPCPSFNNFQNIPESRLPPGKGVIEPHPGTAAQIHDNICAYAKGLNLSTAVIFGGVGYAPSSRSWPAAWIFW